MEDEIEIARDMVKYDAMTIDWKLAATCDIDILLDCFLCMND